MSKSKQDPTVVADFSREDESDNADGSRREMLAQDTVRDSNNGPVGNKRFDANADGADEMP